jgi:hypothetical protein
MSHLGVPVGLGAPGPLVGRGGALKVPGVGPGGGGGGGGGAEKVGWGEGGDAVYVGAGGGVGAAGEVAAPH